jgi:hypothetical protein
MYTADRKIDKLKKGLTHPPEQLETMQSSASLTRSYTNLTDINLYQIKCPMPAL